MGNKKTGNNRVKSRRLRGKRANRMRWCPEAQRVRKERRRLAELYPATHTVWLPDVTEIKSEPGSTMSGLDKKRPKVEPLDPMYEPDFPNQIRAKFAEIARRSTMLSFGKLKERQ